MLALLLPLTCSNCASSNLPVIAPVAVAIPDDCERLLVESGRPATKAGDDARAQLARHRAALAKANNTIKQGRECVTAQRQHYAGAK